MIRYRFFLLAFLALPGILPAQDFREDMQLLRDAYLGAEHFSADIHTRIYQGEGTDAFFSIDGRIRRRGKAFYYAIGDMKMLVTPRVLIMADDATREIVYKHISAREYKNSIRQSYVPESDSIMRLYKDVRYRGITAGSKQYTISLPDFYITEADYYISAEHHTIDRVVYTYNQQLWKTYYMADIRFTNVSAGKPVDRAWVDEKQFVIREKGKLLPAEAYKDYEVIEVTEEED